MPYVAAGEVTSLEHELGDDTVESGLGESRGSQNGVVEGGLCDAYPKPFSPVLYIEVSHFGAEDSTEMGLRYSLPHTISL